MASPGSYLRSQIIRYRTNYAATASRSRGRIYAGRIALPSALPLDQVTENELRAFDQADAIAKPIQQRTVHLNAGTARELTPQFSFVDQSHKSYQSSTRGYILVKDRWEYFLMFFAPTERMSYYEQVFDQVSQTLSWR